MCQLTISMSVFGLGSPMLVVPKASAHRNIYEIENADTKGHKIDYSALSMQTAGASLI